MKKAFKNGVFLSIGALWFGLASPLSADILYANTSNDLGIRFNPGTAEVGNEINLASLGNLTYFSFEYWGTNTAKPDNSTFAGDVEARVTFYLNNGTPPFNGYPTPGPSFWQSDWFELSPTARSTEYFTAALGDFPSGGLPLTSLNMTWTVQFEDIGDVGATDSVGVDLYWEPTVGSAYGDYWENDVGGWTLNTNSLSTSMTFGALMETPEPSSMTLSLLGGLGILIAMRRFRRKE
jgi:hypothetical protein